MKLRKIAAYALAGGFGLVMAGSLAGCDDKEQEQNVRLQEGALVRIEEIAPGKYKILEEFPSEKTRIILKSLDGTERILSDEETKALLAEENAKIDAGTPLSRKIATPKNIQPKKIARMRAQSVRKDKIFAALYYEISPILCEILNFSNELNQCGGGKI